MITVEQLRKEGYKVRVLHNRECFPIEDANYNSVFTRFEYEEKEREGLLYGFERSPGEFPSFDKAARPCGGFTLVEVTTPDGETFSGKYNFKRTEPFVKHKGVSIALAKAIGRHAKQLQGSDA